MLADVVDAVVGIDTHRDIHQIEIALPTGAAIATCTITNDSKGFAELLAWITDRAPGPRVTVSIEGTRSFGLGVARACAAGGLLVVECEQPVRKHRRGTGKSDPIDAHLAVLSALHMDADRLPTPRGDGDREALRLLLSARRELTDLSTARTNRLKALLRDGRDADKQLARGKLYLRVLSAISDRPEPRGANREHVVRHGEVLRFALALREAHYLLSANRKQLTAIVDEVAPGLTDRPGIGPVSAAQVIVSFSHAGRCSNDAAFAALSGTSPLQASSGRTTRHRLNRGGDRQLNCAIHTIAHIRMRNCPTTRDYVARRTADGKSTGEIRRCLKRYIARELHRALTKTLTAGLDRQGSVRCLHPGYSFRRPPAASRAVIRTGEVHEERLRVRRAGATPRYGTGSAPTHGSGKPPSAG